MYWKSWQLLVQIQKGINIKGENNNSVCPLGGLRVAVLLFSISNSSKGLRQSYPATTILSFSQLHLILPMHVINDTYLLSLGTIAVPPLPHNISLIPTSIRCLLCSRHYTKDFYVLYKQDSVTKTLR